MQKICDSSQLLSSYHYRTIQIRNKKGYFIFIEVSFHFSFRQWLPRWRRWVRPLLRAPAGRVLQPGGGTVSAGVSGRQKNSLLEKLQGRKSRLRNRQWVWIHTAKTPNITTCTVLSHVYIYVNYFKLAELFLYAGTLKKDGSYTKTGFPFTNTKGV